MPMRFVTVFVILVVWFSLRSSLFPYTPLFRSTLIELLVVILIIGILAAIALPAFLGQQSKGQGAEANTTARNFRWQVEWCLRYTEDYSQGHSAARLPNTGLSLCTASRTVDVTR